MYTQGRDAERQGRGKWMEKVELLRLEKSRGGDGKLTAPSGVQDQCREPEESC